MVKNLFSLEKKIIIATGSGSGIGQAMALGMAEAGAQLVLVGRTMAKLENSKALLEEHGCLSPLLVSADVSNKTDVQAMVDQVIAAFGRIDVLLNNAGINFKKPFLDIAEEEWHRVIENNLTSQYLVAQTVAKEMVKQQAGKIINTASVGSFQAITGASPYCASKGGVIQLTKVMAVELCQYNIQVNAICPGYIDTGLLTDPAKKQATIDKVKLVTPMGRPGESAELAGAAVFLASDATSYITGTQIVVDGGMSCVSI